MADIIAELGQAHQAFIKAVAQFGQEQFNVVPFEGSWTPGQVAEHIQKSITGVPQLLQSEGIQPDRDPAANVAPIRAMFLDFTTKMKSPRFILPSDEPKDKNQLIQSLDQTLTDIIRVAEVIDLNIIIKDFEFPGSGPMSRLELVNFISVHTQRHTHQLGNIYEELSRK